VSVPDVVGLERSDALAELEGLGLRMRTEMVDSADASEAGIVLGQDPPAGREVDSDSVVEVEVGKPFVAPLVIVPGPVVADASGVKWGTFGEEDGNHPGFIEGFRRRCDDIVDFDSPLGAAVLLVRHEGSSNFIAEAVFDDGSTDAVINEIGTYEGAVLAYSDDAEVVGVNVRADGEW